MDIDSELTRYGMVTYLPYTSPDHLKFLYEQNRDRFDAFLFGGSYPFEIITGTFGPIQKPCAYFNVSDRDYYKMIACLAVQEPNLDFQRVYFDIPDMPVDFRSIFQRENIPLLSEAPIDWDSLDPYDWDAPVKEYYLHLWNSGKVDLIVTRFASLADYLSDHHIRYLYLSPSPESMLETFRGLVMQLRTQSMHDSAACLGLIRSIMPLSKEQWAALGDRLQACNKQFGTPFLIYEHGEHYEITTNISVLKDLTQQYTICPVTAFLEAGCFEQITVMIQREVARRMDARPGTADYGAFSLLMQYYTVPELLFEVPNSCFMPPPKVTSAVVRCVTRKPPPVQVRSEEAFWRTVRAGFALRRKTLVNSLQTGWQLPKEQLAAIVAGCGLSPTVRGEALGLEEYARLSDALLAAAGE